jgi:hypothetical protein
MAVSGIHNPGEKIDRYSWLKTGYVIYSADNNGFIILGDFCSDCDRYIRYLRLEKRRVSRSLSDLAEDINRQSEKLRELLVHAERTEENIKRLRIKHSELYIDNSRYDDLLSTYDDKDYLVMNTRFVVGSNNQDLDTMSRKRSREENDQRYYKSANQEEIPAPSAKRVRYFEIKKEDEDYIPL